MTDKIKILFLAASPLDTSRLRLAEEVREIDKRIQVAKARDQFELIPQWVVTTDDLQRALLRHRPHIVHFSGHGSKTQGIILEDQSGNSQMVDESTLIDLFKILKDSISIIVLNGCYSRHQSDGLSEVIDYTIGVQTTLADDDAILFAASFYQGLAFGRSVKEAFDLANNRLKAKGVAKAKLLVRDGANAAKSLISDSPDDFKAGKYFTTRSFKHRPKSCFILMPFAKKWSDRVFQQIKEILTGLGYQVYRADDLYGHDILEDIWVAINESEVIIADTTAKNPNVFYEIGIAHTLGKRVILLSQSAKDIPFDFKRYRHIIYEDNVDGFEQLMKKLPKYLE